MSWQCPTCILWMQLSVYLHHRHRADTHYITPYILQTTHNKQKVPNGPFLMAGHAYPQFKEFTVHSYTHTHTHTHTCVLIPLDRGRVLSWSSSALLSGSRWYFAASISRANARGFPSIRLSLDTWSNKYVGDIWESRTYKKRKGQRLSKLGLNVNSGMNEL